MCFSIVKDFAVYCKDHIQQFSWHLVEKTVLSSTPIQAIKNIYSKNIEQSDLSQIYCFEAQITQCQRDISHLKSFTVIDFLCRSIIEKKLNELKGIATLVLAQRLHHEDLIRQSLIVPKIDLTEPEKEEATQIEAAPLNQKSEHDIRLEQIALERKQTIPNYLFDEVEIVYFLRASNSVNLLEKKISYILNYYINSTSEYGEILNHVNKFLDVLTAYSESIGNTDLNQLNKQVIFPRPTLWPISITYFTLFQAIEYLKDLINRYKEDPLLSQENIEKFTNSSVDSLETYFEDKTLPINLLSPLEQLLVDLLRKIDTIIINSVNKSLEVNLQSRKEIGKNQQNSLVAWLWTIIDMGTNDRIIKPALKFGLTYGLPKYLNSIRKSLDDEEYIKLFDAFMELYNKVLLGMLCKLIDNYSITNIANIWTTVRKLRVAQGNYIENPDSETKQEYQEAKNEWILSFVLALQTFVNQSQKYPLESEIIRVIHEKVMKFEWDPHSQNYTKQIWENLVLVVLKELMTRLPLLIKIMEDQRMQEEADGYLSYFFGPTTVSIEAPVP